MDEGKPLFTVLEKEQDMDFIFGLDMLKRHQCNIDLKAWGLLTTSPPPPPPCSDFSSSACSH